MNTYVDESGQEAQEPPPMVISLNPYNPESTSRRTYGRSSSAVSWNCYCRSTYSSFYSRSSCYFIISTCYFSRVYDYD
jgi:hypothetical protein